MTMIVRLQEETVADIEWVGEVAPITWSIKRSQDNTGGWSFSIPFTSEYASVLASPLREITAYFYLDGVDQMHGIVDDVQLAVSGDKLVYSVSGLGEAGKLDRVLAMHYSHYFDMELIAMLYDLLEWGDWALGDFSTMLVPNESTTIDTREMKTILPQIRRVCESSPGMHWRYGGLDSEGKQSMDFGYFDEIQDVRLQQGTAQVLTPSLDSIIGEILTMSIRESRVNLISEVHGSGGSYNLSTAPDRQQIMGLWHIDALLTAFPALADPNYPVVVSAKGFKIIRSLALYPVGGSSRETWDFMVTENAVPATLPEVTAGAYGLYKKCIRFLQEHADPDTTYSASVSGLKTMPQVSDRIYVDANFLTTGIPGCGDIQIPGLEVHEDLRVGSLDLKGSGDKITAGFSLTPLEYIGHGVDEDGSDDVEQLQADLGEQPYNRRWGNLSGDFGTRSQDNSTTIQGAGAASDCVLTVSGLLGKSITVAVPAIPVGAVKVFVIGFAPTPAENYTLEIIQAPVLGALPLIVCFTWGRDWTVADAVTLKVYFRFS